MSPSPEILPYAPPENRSRILLRITLTGIILTALLFTLFNLWAPGSRFYPMDGPVLQDCGILNCLTIERSVQVAVHNLATGTWSEYYKTTVYHWRYPALASTCLLTLLAMASSLFALHRVHRPNQAHSPPNPQGGADCCGGPASQKGALSSPPP